PVNLFCLDCPHLTGMPRGKPRVSPRGGGGKCLSGESASCRSASETGGALSRKHVPAENFFSCRPFENGLRSRSFFLQLSDPVGPALPAARANPVPPSAKQRSPR